MTTTEELKQLARQRARKDLSMSVEFSRLPREDQFTTYQNVVDGHYRQLAGATSTGQISRSMAEKASDMIDDKRYENRRIEQAGDLAGDFVQQVDFPKFVRDLLKGVFDANLQVTVAQMDKYMELMKAATASISKFINAIDDTQAFGYLAENESDNFSMSLDDSEKDDNGQPKPVLTDKAGQKLDLGDNEVKAKIMDAKIAMAKEQRTLLRETILMGVSRLVVEKGNVKASVIFDFKADEKIKKADKAGINKQHSTSSSISASGGLLGSIFGGPQAGHTDSTRETRISVSSGKGESSTSLSAKLMGSVDLTFKSDYFKLDNFAQMYGMQQPAAPGPGGQAAPGAPAPVASLPGGPVPTR